MMGIVGPNLVLYVKVSFLNLNKSKHKFLKFILGCVKLNKCKILL